MASKQILYGQENISRQTNVAALPVQTKAKQPAPASVPAQSQPKPPRSAFICFKDSKKNEIMARCGIRKGKDNLLSFVAKEWQNLSRNERAYWTEEARNDKLRFCREKAEYTGPWIVPKRRAKKNPLAPKRPPSAFLKFSQKRRSVVKISHPHLENKDVSMLLGEMWRNATAKEKEPYVEREKRERAIYNEQIKKFREEEAKVDAASRTSHKSVQKMAPPEYHQHGYAEASSSANVDPIRHADVADDGSYKGDQRVMFRHSFGGAAPFSSYHPSWDYGPGHLHAPPSHPPHGYTNPPDHNMAFPHRPLPLLDEEDDIYYNNGNYFSDINFNFYTGYP